MGIIKDITNSLGNYLNIYKKEGETERKPKTISSKTIPQQLLRFNQEISDWKLGIDCFEDPYSPTSVELIRVYNDIVIDSHLSAAMQLRKSKTLSKDFKIIDENGEELKDETILFEKTWFKDMLEYALDSKFYGHSLIQLGKRIGSNFEKTSIVKREYVFQQEKKVRQSPYSNSPSYPYDKGEFKPWLIEAGKCDDMGLLMKAAPLVIFKKTALSSWAQFSEMFGAPLRVGKTQVRDEALRDNMYNMLDQMGSNAFAVLDLEDTIEYIKDGQQDAYGVYDKLIERVNSEISKLILGSTMVMDDGSSRSQAEVHEQALKSIVKSDAFYIEEWVNEEVIPLLNRWHGFNITGKWVFDDSEQISKQEQFERDIDLIKTGAYNIPAEYITETYGTPVETTEEAKPSELENSLKKKALFVDINALMTKEVVCDCFTNQIDSSDILDPEWSDDLIDSLIAGVYAGEVTPENLPEQLYLRLAEFINSGAENGLELGGGLVGLEDEDFIRALKNNGFQFSAAKTFQQVKEMSDFILDENGNLRNFGDYEAKAREIFGKYNKEWLKTEIAQASNSAQMASKWLEIEKDKDFLPYLRYVTAGDARVRPDHAPLDGIIKRVDDDFWDTFYPPNGWNCRCTVLQEAEAVETPNSEIKTPEIPESMKVNVGKQKVLFGPEHPYYIVSPQFEELKGNNFNLPIPGNG
jgi:SPP1 gp7 family putative phage head morphogenesis protein